MKFYLLTSIVWVLCLGTLSFADDRPCRALQSVEDVLACALNEHPDIRQSKVGMSQGEDLEAIAKQRPPLELSSQSVLGKTRGGDLFSYAEFNLAHTFQLGGKRESLLENARAERSSVEAKVISIREQVYQDTLISLYRIRQIQSEQALLKGAIESFQGMNKQFRSRPHLGPEQQASLRIFEIAASDYQLRTAPLNAELDRELRSLEFALGQPFAPTPALLPQQKKDWPKLKHSEQETSFSSGVQLSIAENKLASTQYELQRSSAWPDLKIGPTFEFQNQGASSFNALGINFTIPLPVFHLNGAGRNYALQSIKKSEIGLEASKKAARDQSDYYEKRYQGAVNVLVQSVTQKELNQKHEEVEGFFKRGLIPSTLVIEIHRQMLDFTKSQNEQEIAAMESMIKFYALQGILFKEKL